MAKMLKEFDIYVNDIEFESPEEAVNFIKEIDFCYSDWGFTTYLFEKMLEFMAKEITVDANYIELSDKFKENVEELNAIVKEMEK